MTDAEQAAIETLREELAEAREARDANYATVLDFRSELAEAKAALEKARAGLQYVSDTFPATYEYDNNDMDKIKHDRGALRRSMLHARQVLASLASHPGPESREQAEAAPSGSIPAQTSQRSTNQEAPMADSKKKQDGRYVVIRNDMAGVICGVLIDQNEHRTELAEARIIWDWAGEGIETVHDVAAVGVGPRSHVSRPVAHVSIRGCAGEATIEATAEAEASLRAAVWAK